MVSPAHPGLSEGRGPWAELHCHSHYSFLDGTASPERLAARAASLGHGALALTDHDSLAGVVAHAHACATAGLTPIAGVEITLDDGSHLTLLARDDAGYRSLCRAVSLASLAGPKGRPAATLDHLASCAVGVECLTGCVRGRVPAALLRDDTPAAVRALDDLRAVFGAAHVWLEVQMGGLPHDRLLAARLHRLARQAGAPLAAAGDVHYAGVEERDLHDVLTCIREHVPLTRARPVLRQGASWHLRSPAETARLFRDLPAALGGVRALTERCSFRLAAVDARLPAPPLPDGVTARDHLRALVERGARARYGDAAEGEAVRARLAHEFDVIAALEMDGYFLIVHDIVFFASSQGILCQARGSAVGSAVCYCLGVSAVDPLAHKLSFARFLARGRADPPDIDLDLPSERAGNTPAREAVIQYVLRTYSGHAALVSTLMTYHARSALRDVGRVLGLGEDAVAVLTREQEGGRDGRVGGDGPRLPAGLDPEGTTASRLRDLCAQMEGLPRHRGQHPGGVVLTARPLGEVAPLEPARMAGRVVVQWDKDEAATAGLVKIDLLGLGMLAAIDESFGWIERETGTRPALHGSSCDDPRVYDLFCRADTVGCFQVESRAQMSACLPRLLPRTLDDLAAAVALIRPGPIQGNATSPFLRRREGRERVSYPGGEAGRRLLAPVLGDTYGVILYQDQVVDLAIAAGMGPEDAAALRRAMSKTRSRGAMDGLSSTLEKLLEARGLDARARAEITTMMTAFAGYGFVRGHAVAFAYLAYLSGWLKVYHPAAFYAALLNAHPMGFYPVDVLLQDAARRGVNLLPVDVTASAARWTVERGALRMGLRAVAGLGEDAGARIAAAMVAHPAPATLEALCRAASLDEKETTALARSGALAGLGLERRHALWTAPEAARAARAGRLPGLGGEGCSVTLPAPTPSEEMALDHGVLSFSPLGHPLSLVRADLTSIGALSSGGVKATPRGKKVGLAGKVVARQRPGTARGVVFLSLSDEDGLLDVVVSPEVYERDRAAIRGEALLWVDGVVARRSGATSLTALRVRPLADLLAGRSTPTIPSTSHDWR